MIDTAIIGAGPYGLSVAAHLRAIPGLEVRVFGEPMSFWETRMPRGMLLRSPWPASHLSDPERSLTLESYVQARGNHLPRPIPLERFVDYGKWFQSVAVPDLDRRGVDVLSYAGGTFALRLADGTSVQARRVVIAAGIGPFARYPDEFRGLPEGLASHTSDHTDLGRFAGRRVCVVGGGQSALETAALLREAGAEVEVLVRQPSVHFLVRSKKLHGSLVGRLLYAPTDVGPAGISRLVAAPSVFRAVVPRPVQDSWRVRCTRPAGAAWLMPRLTGVTITTGVKPTKTEAQGNTVEITLDDGSRRCVEHVLLGTGYKVDISRYSFLSPALLGSIARVNGFPCLSTDFETSVPGLHIVGAPAAWSFGPLMQFVAGAPFTGHRIETAVRRREARGAKA